MARLFADEDSPLPVTQELRRLGHDVLTIQDLGMASKEVPDGQVLQMATTDVRAVPTLNRWHFNRMHQQGTVHAGIIACTYDAQSAALAERIHRALGERTELAACLIRVVRPSR